ncbi:hypothetical protein VK199_29035 [Micromonospora sp. CCTCC AA 2012012]|uniref:Uncharacterized protein n=6 Tax=Micromonosporaceae TaxID=28056 RepID=A0AAU8HGG5_9ACTN
MTPATAAAAGRHARLRPRRSGSDPVGTSIVRVGPGCREDRYATSAALARGRTVTSTRRYSMAKKARKKKARKKSGANHGKRPNS